MVSLPSYDPNLFVNGISQQRTTTRLTKDPSRPLFNRNVHGGGPPGSTIKPFVALAGPRSGLRTPRTRVLSTGDFRIPGQRPRLSAMRTAARRGRPARIDRAVGQHLLLPARLRPRRRALRRVHARATASAQPTGIDLRRRDRAASCLRPSGRRSARASPGTSARPSSPASARDYWVATRCSSRAARPRSPTTAIAATPAPRARTARRLSTRPGSRWRSRRRSASPTNTRHLRAVKEGMMATVHGPGARRTRIGVGAPYPDRPARPARRRRSAASATCALDPRSLPYAPAPPGAVRRLRAGGRPDDRGRGDGRARRLRRDHGGADRAQGLRRWLLLPEVAPGCPDRHHGPARPIPLPRRRPARRAPRPAPARPPSPGAGAAALELRQTSTTPRHRQPASTRARREAPTRRHAAVIDRRARIHRGDARTVDWPLLLALCALMGIGLAVLYSAGGDAEPRW